MAAGLAVDEALVVDDDDVRLRALVRQAQAVFLAGTQRAVLAQRVLGDGERARSRVNGMDSVSSCPSRWNTFRKVNGSLPGCDLVGGRESVRRRTLAAGRRPLRDADAASSGCQRAPARTGRRSWQTEKILFMAERMALRRRARPDSAADEFTLPVPESRPKRECPASERMAACSRPPRFRRERQLERGARAG